MLYAKLSMARSEHFDENRLLAQKCKKQGKTSAASGAALFSVIFNIGLF
jgi:hypothetical protein